MTKVTEEKRTTKGSKGQEKRNKWGQERDGGMKVEKTKEEVSLPEAGVTADGETQIL
jgi:hypothetical protein